MGRAPREYQQIAPRMQVLSSGTDIQGGGRGRVPRRLHAIGKHSYGLRSSGARRDYAGVSPLFPRDGRLFRPDGEEKNTKRRAARAPGNVVRGTRRRMMRRSGRGREERRY